MDMDSILQTFIAESRELLEEMEKGLLALNAPGGDPDGETIDAIFRAAHTIKGSAGLFNLDDIVAFTHGVESLLDRMRDGRQAASPDLLSLLLACSDHIGHRVDAVAAGRLGGDATLDEEGAPLVARLNQYLGEASTALTQAGAQTQPYGERQDSTEADNWHISLRFGPDVLRNGMDPLSFLRYLDQMGRIVGIVTLPDALPAPADMDPESCYLGYEIAFRSTADKSTIESVFDFVRDDCQVRIVPPHSRIDDYIQLIQQLPEDKTRLGEILISCGTLTAHELQAALEAQAATEATTPIGEILVESGVVQPAVVEAALVKQKQILEHKAQESRSIRVDADKLDQLINLVGELIIAAASTDLAARRAQANELQEYTSTLSSLVESVRDSALQLRMVKIGATFSRFQRVVHDVAREIGKDIALSLSGEDTELDKTVVEKIADPLTHLVRNAIDHGIEPVDVRLARGKPARGTVGLNAYHDSGSIVIEVSDDGGGLRRDRILAKALERGLIEPGRTLTDAEVFALIFEPGFSTAETITNLSGRGVGMDVVKRNITALRGSIDIASQEGVGTTMTVRLPLTLAIINGFLVSLGDAVFVVPLDMIEECVEFQAEPGHDYTNLRGQVLPFIRLRERFGLPGPEPARQNIVVVRHAGHKAGLVVDTLLGEFQTVIKPLGRMFQHLKCISGSTILGNGEVALILDVPALIEESGHGAAPPRLHEAVADG